MVKRLYDALSAMMYGWEDDAVRAEAFAALKAAEPLIDPPPDLRERAQRVLMSFRHSLAAGEEALIAEFAAIRAEAWDDAEAALTRHARLDSTGDEVKAAFHIAVNWLAVHKSVCDADLSTE